ncbi:hypothetical protein EV368DRAFT_88025 [Lentinula lateritia]|nr:hypothetical protein EV368DRAFT_88025 [Lentinula lateritia]
MSSPSKNTHRSSLPSPTAASNLPVPHEEGGFPPTEDEEDVDQLAFTLDSPSHPQLEFFEKVFNTGKPLAGYSSNDPLWSLLWLFPAPTTCSLGKILQFWYSARKCNQDLAYSRRFLELHGTPAQKASWTIPVDLWRRYDVLLHGRTSSTTALMELNMLDDSDALDRDHQKLSQFLDTQRQETVAASKQKHVSSPVRPRGATSSEAPAKTSHKRHRHLSPPTSLPSILPVANTTSLPLPSHAPVMAVDLGPLADAGIQRLPVLADHPGLVQGPTGLGTSQDLLSSNMPPCRSRLIPHSHTTYPYRVENEQLSPFARYLPLIGSSATGGGAIADLPVGGYTAGVGVLLSLGTVPRSGEGSPRASRAVERLHKVQEELLSAREEKEVAEGCHSSSACQNSELQASIVQHQGLVDENNALAARQCQRIETLQEEVH